MSDNARLDELLQVYGAPGASAAHLLCDRHPADAVAFTVVEGDLSSRDVTYGELRSASIRFAAALADLGVSRRDAVAVLMGKSAELVIALLGIWRLGAVHVPLFTAFAPPAIALRLDASAARVVVVDADQCGKLEALDAEGHSRWRTVVVGGDPGEGQLDFASLLAAAPAGGVDSVAVGPDGDLVLLFTSGTTGAPKGVPVPLRALASFQVYLELGLDVLADDVFWNAADPGWAYGLYYAILAPLAAGRRSLLLHAGFSAELTLDVLERFGVTNFAAAPTVYRALRAHDGRVPNGMGLRRASSAGEPLTPEVVTWAQEHLGVTVRDHYGQTEHGMLIVDGWADAVRAEVPARSMGRVMPGFAAGVLAEDADVEVPSGTVGRVAVRVDGSPLMWFVGYAGDAQKTAERFTVDGSWYLTGDAGSVDSDGFFTFSARDDDIIIMAGYRIGPFEVESVLLTHPRVIEAAAVGVPDALRGEVLEAYVVLRPGDGAGDDALVTELQQLVKTQFAAHAYPRSVHFVPELPKTSSGKVQRFVLRERRRAELASVAG